MSSSNGLSTMGAGGGGHAFRTDKLARRGAKSLLYWYAANSNNAFATYGWIKLRKVGMQDSGSFMVETSSVEPFFRQIACIVEHFRRDAGEMRPRIVVHGMAFQRERIQRAVWLTFAWEHNQSCWKNVVCCHRSH